jgi:alanine transaminase
MYKKANFFFKDVNERVLKAEYAVRGLVPTMANEIKIDLAKNPSKYPFKEVTFCNIGNPQEFSQKPISFNRQALSVMVNP